MKLFDNFLNINILSFWHIFWYAHKSVYRNNSNRATDRSCNENQSGSVRRHDRATDPSCNANEPVHRHNRATDSS